MCVFLCVFFPFWTSSSLDVPAGVTQEEGHTGFFIHLPSAVRTLIFLARRIQPFLSLVDGEVEIHFVYYSNDLIVLHSLGILLFILYPVKKIPLTRDRRDRTKGPNVSEGYEVTSELPGRPAGHHNV